MGAIKTVAVVGASGNIGAPVVKELLAAGFTVTALAREDSQATFPAGVTVKKTDYSSFDSLKAALAGQDAVVSTIATLAIGNQIKLIDAAFAVGVKRIIPSEFGIHTRTLQLPGLKAILSGKIKALDYIIEKSAENPAVTWTAVTPGLFFDWGLKLGFLGYDPKTKSATIIDSGNEPFPASNLAFIAKAVSAILKRPEETANRYLAIASFSPTQRQILEIAEELTGGEKWTVNQAYSTELKSIGEDKLSQGEYGPAFTHLLRAHLYADGAGQGLTGGKGDNELLGLEEEDLKESIRKWLVEIGII